MRINSINNNYRKPQLTFGYNKELNKELVGLLLRGKKDRMLKDELLALNTKCIDLEDLLKKRTNNARIKMGGYFSAEIETLISIFTDLKLHFSKAIDKYYPHMGFSVREAAFYKAESIAQPRCYWLKEVADSLTLEEPASVQSLEEAVAKGYLALSEIAPKLPAVTEVKPKTAEIISQSSAPKASFASAESKPKIISELLPTTSSPQGFDSLAGMMELKEDLGFNIVEPIRYPQKAEHDKLEYGITFPRASLLYGPPGCGKTFMAEAIAREAGVPIYVLKISQAGSSYINKTPQNYEAAFEVVAKRAEQEGKPSIMFIDEMAGQTSKRSESTANIENIKSVDTLLQLIEGARDKNIIVIGATNQYDLMDEAMRSRFDYQQYVGMPDLETRIKVLMKFFEGKSKAQDLLSSEDGLRKIAAAFDEFPTRAIVDLSKAAARKAKNDGRRPVSIDDLLKVIAENTNLKVNEELYKPKKMKRGRMGFGVFEAVATAAANG